MKVTEMSCFYATSVSVLVVIALTLKNTEV
jgi:hypothetical protein